MEENRRMGEHVVHRWRDPMKASFRNPIHEIQKAIRGSPKSSWDRAKARYLVEVITRA
jgi:hypothetical protein